jgi:hypothetical protein
MPSKSHETIPLKPAQGWNYFSASLFRCCPCHNESFILGDYRFEDTEIVTNGMQVNPPFQRDSGKRVKN